MYLITPLKNEDIKKLRIQDVVYLSGKVYTARDQAHQRALKEGKFPYDLSRGVLFHSGPLAKQNGKNWEIVSVGPTTSSRMNTCEPGFIERFGVKAIIGKGGMDKKIADAMKGKAVYLAMTGGCAATASSQIEKVAGVEWLDLGAPEAVWALEVVNLGPLIVAIDSTGKSIYEGVEEKVKHNLARELGELQ